MTDTPQPALDEIATEQWTVEPYASDEIPMYITTQSEGFRPMRILKNVNMEDDEMHAVASLPDVLRRLKQAEARITELEQREATFLTYGQGGAEYWESQYLDRLRGMEERAEQAEAELAVMRDQRRQISIIVRHMEYDGRAAPVLHYATQIRAVIDAAVAVPTQEQV